MNYERIIVVMKHDLIGYPPMLSLLNCLLDLMKEVVYVGTYSVVGGKEQLMKRGVIFEDIGYNPRLNIKNGFIRHVSILSNMLRYKHEFKRVINRIRPNKEDLFWVVFSNLAAPICNTLKEFNYVVQFYEFMDADFGGRFKRLFPSYNAESFLTSAKKIVHCEYNRAVIMNGRYGITGDNYILPNKPYLNNESLDSVPEDIDSQIQVLKQRLFGKRVIIYQGIFSAEERPLDAFCEAIGHLSDDIVLVIMGEGKGYLESIKEKYASERIVFVPFIRPPFHLLVTQMASIGILSYFPVKSSLEAVINPLYCAPNKIFEYSRFSKPMISNEVPALRYVFDRYGCGEIIGSMPTPTSIADCVLKIFSDYENYCNGSKKYYDSVDTLSIVSSIIS